LEEINSGWQAAKFDLSVYAEEGVDSISCLLEYASDLFDRESIEWCACRLEMIVHQVVKDAKISIGDIDLLLAFERERLIRVPVVPEATSTRPSTLHE